ncbi:unnamed protein product [Cuscuta campestris]|uniref:Uncharacterized protein n=1 Tax=Cuscuta campestris TaxID=132261 RepID=A0A484N9Z1_9ASTE|nr:unnamed protein product [Cuscuta campestris]
MQVTSYTWCSRGLKTCARWSLTLGESQRGPQPPPLRELWSYECGFGREPGFHYSRIKDLMRSSLEDSAA